MSEATSTVEAVNLIGLNELHTAGAIERDLREFSTFGDGEISIVVLNDYMHLTFVAWIYLADYHIAVETIVAFASTIDREETK